MKRFLPIAAMLLAAACQRAEPKQAAAPPAIAPSTNDTFQKEEQEWRANRAKRLQAEDGWLTLTALQWLHDGENAVPGSNGKVVLDKGKVTLRPASSMTIDGKPVTAPAVLADDTADAGPTIVQMDTKRFQIIKRGERFALRMKDSQAETRTRFLGLDYFPLDPKWRVEARWEPYNPPKNISITDITGMVSDNPSPGALVFTVDGKEYRLDPIQEGEDLFIIFKDATSRDSTYQAGRYVYAKMPGKDGKVIVDFNKAYNPPCAFTPFATCPLPPAQNRFDIRIEAGEKRYRGAHA